MSRTYRHNKTGRWDDEHRLSSSSDANQRRRQYATPRYRSGSRRKPHHIVVTGVRREPPDLDPLMRAIARAAPGQASDGLGNGSVQEIGQSDNASTTRDTEASDGVV